MKRYSLSENEIVMKYELVDRTSSGALRKKLSTVIGLPASITASRIRLDLESRMENKTVITAIPAQ